MQGGEASILINAGLLIYDCQVEWAASMLPVIISYSMLCEFYDRSISREVCTLSPLCLVTRLVAYWHATPVYFIFFVSFFDSIYHFFNKITCITLVLYFIILKLIDWNAMQVNRLRLGLGLGLRIGWVSVPGPVENNLSHGTPAVTDVRPSLDIYQRTEGLEFGIGLPGT